jgi:hypothetical protein
MNIISPNSKEIQYSGRIDFENSSEPVLVYAASFFKVRFTGKVCRLTFRNHHSWAENAMGIILDGVQGKIILSDDREPHTYDLSKNCIRTEDGKVLNEDKFFAEIGEGEHELTVFKRQDGGQHYVSFLGMELGEGEKILAPEPLPSKKLEVIGDSVSCGEVCEAIDCVASPDPENNEGRFSNSWYSYSWQVARNLNLELHDTSQGGISLIDGTGWFNMPDLRGVESSYDKLKYNPPLGENVWDHTKWIPDVIVLAFGQNDANPEDIMKDDYNGEKARTWRMRYEGFIRKLQGYYPDVTIICTTTLLMHDPAWDKAIDDVVKRIDSPKVHHFMYKRNGAATPGHPRIPEHDEMAHELTEFIRQISFE